MKGYRLRLVATEIRASATHCSNDCDHLATFLTGPVRCVLFACELKWDKRKKKHGHTRAKLCVAAEELLDDV